MANCLIWNATPRYGRQHITQNRTATPFSTSSSSSIPLPTSCFALPSPLLFPDPEGSASSSLPGAASVSSVSVQLPPGSLVFRLRRLACPRLVLICLASLERPSLRGLPRRSPIRSCQQRFIVIVPRLIHVFVSTFCMGILTWFLCRGHLKTRIPHVLVLNPHWHAELDPELALRQPGLVNSRLHALRHLVMVAPCPIRPLLFGQLQRTNLRRIIERCHFRGHVHIATKIMAFSVRSLVHISVAIHV